MGSEMCIRDRAQEHDLEELRVRGDDQRERVGGSLGDAAHRRTGNVRCVRMVHMRALAEGMSAGVGDNSQIRASLKYAPFCIMRILPALIWKLDGDPPEVLDERLLPLLEAIAASPSSASRRSRPGRRACPG